MVFNARGASCFAAKIRQHERQPGGQPVTRVRGSIVGICLIVASGLHVAAQEKVRPADCVMLGRPKPTASYVYEHVQSNGVRTETTQQWESVTDEGFRLRATGAKGVEFVVNEHEIVDGIAVLRRTRKQTANGAVLEATSFEPGLVSDPATRVCAGQSRAIPAVTARFSSREINHAVTTPAGTLRIVAINERITVPAGTFNTVHYIRTSQSTDEYWKSIEHGVIVKHVGRLPGDTVTDTLVAIR